MDQIPELKQIPVDAVKVFIHRARAKAGFEQLKESMAEAGLRYPIQVRVLPSPYEDGKRYELICGEGRLTAATDLGWSTIAALVVSAPAVEIAGRFLAENMIRKPLGWAQKGRMIRERMRATGETLQEVAKALHITEGHARKYLRVLDKAAHDVEDEVAAMPMNDAEVFTTLPAAGQKIVLEVVKETGAPVREVTKFAKAVEKKEGEGWTKAALQKAISKIDTDLKRARDRKKMLMLHHSLGPQNIAVLLKKRGFKAALEKAGVNLAKIPEA